MGKLDGVFLYDLDDLRTVAEANMRERRKEAAAAEALVEREAREFLEWQKSLDVVPLLKELRSRAEEIRRTEVDKARRRLGPLTPEQDQALEAATEAIVQKLLHAPTVQLKEMVKNGHPPEQISLFRKLLGLSAFHRRGAEDAEYAENREVWRNGRRVFYCPSSALSAISAPLR